MAKTDEQGERPMGPTSAARGESTRAAILNAAAELIAELGWGGVSTRAIAERAQVPHGAVSYHFNGKQDVLREAALVAARQIFDDALPATEGVTAGDLIVGAAQWYRGGIPERWRALLVELTMASTRDDALRERYAELLNGYRALVIDAIRADQAAGRIDAGIDAADLSSVIIAALDGMLLHAIAAPGYDVARAADALYHLVYRRGYP